MFIKQEVRKELLKIGKKKEKKKKKIVKKREKTRKEKDSS